MVVDIKTISVAISESDYEAFRAAAKACDGSIAQLIRAAMSDYRARVLNEKTSLTDLPALAGHRPIRPLPSREEIYDEAFNARGARS
jgi:hypothetical protein